MQNALCLTPEGREFLTDRHLATLSTSLPDGSIHVVPVGFVVVGEVATIITSRASQKVVNVRRTGHATLCQFEGARWITLLGRARIDEDAEPVANAVALYARRYRQPRPNPERVVIVVDIERVLASAGLTQ